MKMITVGDLKEFLKNIPDDYFVIFSKDAEGNTFSPMSKDVLLGKYTSETKWFGDFEADNDNATSIAIFPIG
jgi:hypothetical protein